MNSIKKLFIALFGLCSFSSHAAPQAQSAPQPEPPQSTHSQEQNKQRQFCKDYLHKVTSLDDLIRQMFQTAVFDDCLYDMQPEILQEIWGIPVIAEGDYLDYSARDADVPSPFPFFVHYYQDINRKTLSLSLNAQGYKQDGTLFPSGNFPDFIPDPSSSVPIDYSPIHGRWLQLSRYYRAKPDAQIKPNRTYTWINVVGDNNFIQVSADIAEEGAILRLLFESSPYPSHYFNKLPHVKQFKTQ